MDGDRTSARRAAWNKGKLVGHEAFGQRNHILGGLCPTLTGSQAGASLTPKVGRVCLPPSGSRH